MAVAIALDKPNHPASSAAQNAGPAGGTRASGGSSPFAAVLAKTHPEEPRRTGAPRTFPAARSRPSETRSADPSSTRNDQTAGAKPPQRPDAQTGTTAQAKTQTPAEPADNGAGSPPARTTAVAPAAPRGARMAPTKAAEDVSVPPTPAPQPNAALPDLAQNAAAEAPAQADPGTTVPFVSEQCAAAAAAPAIPTLDDSSAPSDDADPSAGPDAAPAESLATPGGEPALPLKSAASGQDGNSAEGALLPQPMPAEAAASSPSLPRASEPAPASPEWAEARETVSIRTAQAVQDGVQNVSIDLHPAELGHVGIELSFHAGRVSVQMTLSRQDTYEAFSRDRAALEQQLAQTGINLGSGGLDLRFDQKRDQPQASSGPAFAARIPSVRPEAGALPAARPRTTRGLLNIIA